MAHLSWAGSPGTGAVGLHASHAALLEKLADVITEAAFTLTMMSEEVSVFIQVVTQPRAHESMW